MTIYIHKVEFFVWADLFLQLRVDNFENSNLVNLVGLLTFNHVVTLDHVHQFIDRRVIESGYSIGVPATLVFAVPSEGLTQIFLDELSEFGEIVNLLQVDQVGSTTSDLLADQVKTVWPRQMLFTNLGKVNPF